MRTRICAELATGHGGSLETALKMIDAAAAAGADATKIQHYGAVNPKDPQAAWLNQSRLHIDAIQTLCERAHGHGLEFWATPFNVQSLVDLLGVGVDRLKIASSESDRDWWVPENMAALSPRKVLYVVSYPWGNTTPCLAYTRPLQLTAIPMYPTPIECVGQATLLDGWSDHVVGTLACQYAIMRGAQWLEVHFTLCEGQSRVMAWDKTVADVRQLRQFANDVETMRSGVSQVYRDRWTRA